MRTRTTLPVLIAAVALALFAPPASARHTGDDTPTLELGEQRCHLGITRLPPQLSRAEQVADARLLIVKAPQR